MTTLVNAGIVTVAGVTLLVQSQLTGARAPVVDSVQISPNLMACTGDETEMDAVAFVVPREDLVPSSPTPGILRVGVVLGQSVGDFQIGTLGLFVGTTLFALATFPGAGTKLASNPPLSSGNARTLYVDTAYVGVGDTATPTPPVQVDTTALVQSIIFGS